MQNVILLLVAGFLAWKYKDQLMGGDSTVNPGHSTTSNEVSTGNTDYVVAVHQATNLPTSDGITPGILPDGSIRTLPPATPAQATAAAASTGVSYTPQVVDGNWINAPAQTQQSLYQAQNIAVENRGKPQILPPPTHDMLQELAMGRSFDEILGAAAAGDLFHYGGASAWNGFYLPISAWNWYRDNYRPGSVSLAGTQVVSAEEYNALRTNAGLSGLGCDCGPGSGYANPYSGMPVLLQ